MPPLVEPARRGSQRQERHQDLQDTQTLCGPWGHLGTEMCPTVSHVCSQEGHLGQEAEETDRPAWEAFSRLGGGAVSCMAGRRSAGSHKLKHPSNVAPRCTLHAPSARPSYRADSQLWLREAAAMLESAPVCLQHLIPAWPCPVWGSSRLSTGTLCPGAQ